MMNEASHLKSIYRICGTVLGTNFPEDFKGEPSEFAGFLNTVPALIQKYPYISNLAAIEWSRHSLSEGDATPKTVSELCINPNLELLQVEWSLLPELLEGNSSVNPLVEEELVLLWREPKEGRIIIEKAESHDLLAMKIVSEEIDPRRAAVAGKVSIGAIDDVVFQATNKGLLLTPASKIVRAADFPRGIVGDDSFFSSSVFTLQWHITQKCDLHCKHCYDRSEREILSIDQSLRILDDLYDFCRQHYVYGQISFTGGNPLLYPHFNEVYQAASDRGFITAILGNPMPRHRIEELVAIQKPEFYQVSLEGLKKQTDYIRGPGHYERVFSFLDLLRELDIYSMVMLTLTSANMGEVIELAEVIKDRVDLFTFNRLSMVGEGSALASAPIDEYPDFLEKYLEATANNSAAALKDNFFNILHLKEKKPFFGGCAGYGCGAAFNFVSLLPDGQVDACRKFPSPIGNIFENSLSEIYHQEAATRYRAGSQACSDCKIRPVCGGCLAVAHGFGLDVLKERDPYCFIDEIE